MTASPLILGPDRQGRTLVIEGKIIAFFGSELPSKYRSLPRRSFPEAQIEAGAVNGHTHLYSALVPLGLPAPSPAPSSFPEILQQIWWRLDRALDAGTLGAAARLGIAESLLFGTTTLIDHQESPHFIEGSLDVLDEARRELGIRAALCYGATDRNGGEDEGRRGIAECERLALRQDDELRVAVGLHASFSCSDATLHAAREACERHALPIHVHVAEDRCDLEDARRRGFRDPVQRLLLAGLLRPHSILAHGIHLEEAAVRTAAEAGCRFVQNPRSNQGNAVGYPLALGATDRVGLGSDGYPSDMAQERALLLRLGTDAGESPSLLARRCEASAELASELFGQELGRLEAGATADVVLRDESGVRQVYVSGRCVVRDGALVNGEIVEIREQARIAARKLWKKMAEI